MSTTYEQSAIEKLREELTEFRRNWFLFVLLGVALIVVGIIALGSVVVASIATAVAIGVLLLVAGVAETVGSFWSLGWSGFLLHLLSGAMSIVVGVFCLKVPVDALLALTLLVACLLTVGGILKIVASLSHRFEAWGWPLVSGVIDLILGVLIWLQWPASALWVLGLFLGISLVFRGFNWIGLGIALRESPSNP